ncbi:MAG: alkaline phosphatase family protein [Solirubrobacteraceae bacterium]
MGVERPQQCPECGSPLADDQRYCLGCGARVCPRSPLLEPLLGRVSGRVPATLVRPQNASAPAALAPAPKRTSSGLRLPPLRISLLLVLVFLGFGVVLGDAASSRVSDTLASARSPLKVVLPATAPSGTTAATSSSEASSSASGNETSSPESEPEPTPAPVAKAHTTPAKAPSSPSGSSATEGGSSGSEGGSSGSGGGSSKSESASGPAKKLPPIKHVFVVMLSDEPYASVFGPSSTAPYLSGTLEHKGELLVHYDAVAHEELANELALISGQGPTVEMAANCPNYTEIAGASPGPEEQVLGSGCVYPAATQTLAGQLTAKHLTWRAYVQGIDEAGEQAPACAHPTLGQADPTAVQTASTGTYATFRNPFVYFASIVDSAACAADDVGLASLKTDLASVKSTPSFSYIVPDRCHDGNPTPCTPGAPAGMAPAETFLKQVVPEITSSKAYKESGLLVITVDEAPSTGAFADSSSCCGQPLFPNDPEKTLAGAPRGGGAVGALLLSPYVKGGTTSQEPYNHFSLLRTIEDLFSLKHLGYAGLSAVKSLEPELFTAGKV